MKKLFSLGKKNRLIQNNIELVSFHIPKTGGTSFRHILKDIYGEEGVIRLDSPLNVEEVKFTVEQQPFSGHRLPDAVRVVHGHFRYQNLVQILELPEGIPMVTWLRHPVERVASNYFYLAKRLKGGLNEGEKGLNSLSKMQHSLIKYAADELSRNRQSKFLEGLSLEDFTFVGILENKQEDLEYLARLLGWNIKKDYWYNATGKAKKAISPEERALIAQYNEQDMALYEQALALAAQRKQCL